MRTIITGLMAAACGVALSSPTLSHGYKRKSIEIVHPWTADKPQPGGRDAIVSMDIKNAGADPDRLVGATSMVAERVEVHTGSGAKAIEVAPRGRVDLTANSQHLRLVGLKKALTAYDTLPVTLVFERAGRIRIDVLVEESSE